MASKVGEEPRQTDKWAPAREVRSSLIVHARCATGGGYVRGSVKTPLGIVDVHPQGLQYVGPTPLQEGEGALQSTTRSRSFSRAGRSNA